MLNKLKPHWLYLKYVIRHKYFVFVAGRALGVSRWRLIKHDWSKFLPSEWFAYVNYFYGMSKEELTVGSNVWVNCMDGFSGLARVIAARGGQEFEQSHYKVKMLPVKSDACVDPLEQEFWAHDWELDFNHPEVNNEHTQRVSYAFDRAWLKHQHRNDHHWQHWTLRQDSGEVKPLYIPVQPCLEMVADWLGAGRAITGSWEADTWYQKNRDVIVLHEMTRPTVELYIQLALRKLAPERTKQLS